MDLGISDKGSSRQMLGLTINTHRTTRFTAALTDHGTMAVSFVGSLHVVVPGKPDVYMNQGAVDLGTGTFGMTGVSAIFDVEANGNLQTGQTTVTGSLFGWLKKTFQFEKDDRK